MRVKLVEIGDGLGTMLLPIPTSILNELNWAEGDYVSLEIVVDHRGNSTHIVIEKVTRAGA